jgi:uncharacterized protein (TIGR02118 family)
MIKMVSIFTLPKGADPDGFWKYWKEIHVPDVKELRPSLKKYTINRIDHKIVGEDKFWGLIETWWESEDDMRLAFSSLEGKEVANDFWSRVTGRYSVIVEEEEIDL